MIEIKNKQVLRSIEKIQEKLRKLEESVKDKLISETTYICLKNLKEKVAGLIFDFEFTLDFDWRLAEEEFKVDS